MNFASELSTRTKGMNGVSLSCFKSAVEKPERKKLMKRKNCDYDHQRDPLDTRPAKYSNTICTSGRALGGLATKRDISSDVGG
jgi:hypothetical protein